MITISMSAVMLALVGFVKLSAQMDYTWMQGGNIILYRDMLLSLRFRFVPSTFFKNTSGFLDAGADPFLDQIKRGHGKNRN